MTIDSDLCIVFDPEIMACRGQGLAVVHLMYLSDIDGVWCWCADGLSVDFDEEMTRWDQQKNRSVDAITVVESDAEPG